MKIYLIAVVAITVGFMAWNIWRQKNGKEK
jgi:hypothetical protein|nr:MAG TPA: FeoB-associated Cys-rich membrane protein [Caudoviricetes sp.]